ncbi:hypothetical protein ACFW1A_27720 [Kitasatospora sp. NPDC058965]|uniref:hypothetical protein n=1 Tax=Kitasatospora sp. NPDC058965 TaxID=3346682 RepID=UPI00369DBE08
MLLGALTTYLANELVERSKRREKRRVRWDAKKLAAYAEYIGQVRSVVHTCVLLFEVREGMRSMARSEHDLAMDLTEAGAAQAVAFERVMLLAGTEVIDRAHAVQEATAAIGWQARGVVIGTLDEWRELHATVFRAINQFHECARSDLRVSGTFEGDQHTARGLLLPGRRQPD